MINRKTENVNIFIHNGDLINSVKYANFQSIYENCKYLKYDEIISFVNKWIINHIEKNDKKYSELFKEKGIQ